MEALFFWLFSIGMIVCALAVVLNRNAVASALCFTFTIVFMSGLFVMLSAFFLAAVQILVTAGAVMVLFLFIIMLLDVTALEHQPRRKIWTACSVVLALSFICVTARVLHVTPQVLVTRSSAPDITNQRAPVNLDQSVSDKSDDTHQIGRLLFSTIQGRTSYVAPFEITSLLILIATVGVIVLCKQDERPRARRHETITREAPPVSEKESVLRN